MSRSQGTEKGESGLHRTSEVLVRFSSRCLSPLSGIPTRGLLTSGDEAAPSIVGCPHIQFRLPLAVP